MIESWPDGRRVQTSLDGVRIERFPDGHTVQTDSTGTIVERLADGTLLPPTQPKITQRCVSCTKCQTIITMPSDAFVICCPMCRNIMLGHQIPIIGSTQKLSKGGVIQDARKKVQWGKTNNDATDVKALFDRFDVNRSGGIDRDEIRPLLEALNFPPTAFSDIFLAADGNDDGELQFHEFVQYFNSLNSAILAVAQAPDLAMTAQMMEEQKVELRKAESELCAEQQALQKQLAVATITNCDDLADKKRLIDEQLLVVQKELVLREKHLETAIKEQHRRRREALHLKVANRRASKVVGATAAVATSAETGTVPASAGTGGTPPSATTAGSAGGGETKTPSTA